LCQLLAHHLTQWSLRLCLLQLAQYNHLRLATIGHHPLCGELYNLFDLSGQNKTSDIWQMAGMNFFVEE
jgi:hypothetical protein